MTVQHVIDWYRHNARSLPWRDNPSPWAVMVSEYMLQQTPVSRVLPVYRDWMQRWPRPRDLAREASGEAVRAWGRLGYPRRALRLHAAAVTLTREYDGLVPSQFEQLRALPGVGDYTAAAIASFAFGGDHAVLDINVRRVFTRVFDGSAYPASAPTNAERQRAADLLPAGQGPEWAAATMELGALVCTSRNPQCQQCPLAGQCRWRLDGYPAAATRSKPSQSWQGTDRQCRGRIMAALREADGPVSKGDLDLIWPDADQYERCLGSLIADGLVDQVRDHPVSEAIVTLPGKHE